MKAPPIKALKTVAWVACLVQLIRLVYKGFSGTLGANPIEFITLSTGISTLVLLMATLAITPLRRATGFSSLVRLRRLLGLFAFFYGFLHFTTYIWLDKFFDFSDILKDIVKRPFVTAGFFAFVLLVPLAATSTRWAISKMGGRRWQQLHRLVYVSTAAAVVHFWWKQKADVREPLIYAVVLSALLCSRLAGHFISKGRERRRAFESSGRRL